MKGGLCVIYTSLLTISVLSSCALFMLVVSEGHLGVDEGSVDLSGLHNVSQKRGAVSDEDQTPDPGPPRPPDEEPVENLEMIYADSLSLNSVTTDGDLIVVETYLIDTEGRRHKVALASCYLPGDGDVPTKELEEMVLRYRGKQEDWKEQVWERRRDNNLELKLWGNGLNDPEQRSTARLFPARRPYTTSTSTSTSSLSTWAFMACNTDGSPSLFSTSLVLKV